MEYWKMIMQHSQATLKQLKGHQYYTTTVELLARLRFSVCLVLLYCYAIHGSVLERFRHLTDYIVAVSVRICVQF